MSPSRRTFVAGAAIAIPLNARSQHSHSFAPAPGAPDSFGAQMHRAMTTMADGMASAPMSGDPDRDFLAMMIPHHQGAIDMARLVLMHGRDPLTRQLAEEIIAAQQAEISSMTLRLRVLTGTLHSQGEDFPALSGTRGN